LGRGKWESAVEWEEPESSPASAEGPAAESNKASAVESVGKSVPAEWERATVLGRDRYEIHLYLHVA
jgi:hypothetical protein